MGVGAKTRSCTGARSPARRLAAAVATLVCALLAVAAPAAADWEPAKTVDNGVSGFGAAFPDSALAAGPNGLATALFFQATPTTPGGQAGPPYAIRRAASSTWSAPAAVATPSGSVDGFARPALAAGSDGGALGVFNFLRDSSPFRVVAATNWPAGAPAPDAATPALCASGAECGLDPPKVALDSAGNGYLTATSGDGSILFARRDAGTGTWGPAEVVANGSEQSRLAVSPDGDVVVVYTKEDNGNPVAPVRRIQARRKLAGEVSFGPEVQVSGPNTVDSDGHAVVIDKFGDATIVFPEDTVPPGGGLSPAAPVIRASSWSHSSATPDAAVQVSDQSVGQARLAVAAVDPEGRVTAAWQSFSSHFEVFAAELSGGAWSAPQLVSSQGSDRNSSNPRVAVDGDGTATVAYSDNAPPASSDVDVKASRRPTGGSWSAPISLRFVGVGAGAVAGGSQRVAAGLAGVADVVFAQQVDGTSRLFATRFVPTCLGKLATIVGTDASDNLVGTAGDDVIVGLEGNDTISGLGGKDRICGGDGSDKLIGGLGADGLSGQAGVDTADYASRTTGVTVDIDNVADDGNSNDGPPGARDNVRTDVENINGGAGADTLTGSFAKNSLAGHAGADVFNGLGSIDTVTYTTRTVGLTVDIDGVADDGNSNDGPPGARDNVMTDIENLSGGAGADALTGSGAANVLRGGAGADSLLGLGANDTLFANDGTADTQINCDGGTADSAHVDAQDPATIGCESVGP